VSVVLLDTHVLLWAAADSPRLSPATRDLLTGPGHEVVFSVVNLWEVVIKNSLGRADFSVDPFLLRSQALQAGFRELPVRGHHVLGVAALPPIHADPFDRMLLAQAISEQMTLLSADKAVLAYGDPARQA
jgi:PIN domain nuclease of toxin-antitoxin system